MKNLQAYQQSTGLYFLAFTEMWEKFSFFGMRTILVYYMTKQLLFSQGHASHIYGLYTGLVYFTPFFGGILADKFFGRHRCIIIGSVLMVIGYFLIAVKIKAVFFLALLLLILGCGAFTPNISARVGSLYSLNDGNRDRAFSIFYLGINIGAFLSPIVCGTLGEVYGWNYGFGAAGVGMIIGLLVYFVGQKYLLVSENKEPYARVLVIENFQGIKSRFTGFVSLLFFMILFRIVYGQQGNTLAVWLDVNTDRHVFGWEMPASWFQSFNPLMIMFFTPVITILWKYQAKYYSEPSSITKIAIGCTITGFAFIIMALAAYGQAVPSKAHLLWPTICIFLITIGELYVCPISLSFVTKIAPRISSIMLGIWFLSYFIGNYLSGVVGCFWELVPKEVFFLILSIVAFVAGFGMLAVTRPLFQDTLNKTCQNFTGETV